MDEMLLNELYGSEEARQDEEVKLAQAELVEAVAAEAGVDLNELDDEELEKFAHYVLSDEDEIVDDGEIVDEPDYADHEKIAEAELVGRTMARAYADEMAQINSEGESMDKVASAMYDVAEAWEMQKIAESKGKGKGKRDGRVYIRMGREPLLLTHEDAGNFSRDARAKAKLRSLGEMTGILGSGESALKRGGRLGATVAAGGLGILGAKSAYDSATGEKKTASYADWMFEKLAEEAESVSTAKDRSPSGGRQRRQESAYQRRAYSRKGKDNRAGGTISRRRARDYMGKLKRLTGVEGQNMEQFLGKRGLRLASTAGALGIAGAGGKMAYDSIREDSKKTASLFLDNGYEALAVASLYEPEEFAKEAELRAAEILAANGIHPETFEEIYPEEVKLASFPGIEDAADEHEAVALEEYNDMLDAAAEHIIESLLED